MTVTARDIIKKSMQKIGALVKSEAPSSDEANDGLSALNAMIASWSNESLVLNARTLESFTFSGGTQNYTIGSGGTFNTTRPNNILDGYTRIGTIDYPMTIVSDEVFDSISFKPLQGIPQYINFDGAYPLATLKIYPIPQGSYTFYLLSEKSIAQFTTLDTAMSLPDGWERALIYNLALELAPEYSQQPDQYTLKVATESKGNLKRAVLKIRDMDCAPRTLTVRDIYSGFIT